MKLLPLYTNCILKNDILLGGKFSSSLHCDMNFWVLQGPKLLVFLHLVWKFKVSKLIIGKLHNLVTLWPYVISVGRCYI